MDDHRRILLVVWLGSCLLVGCATTAVSPALIPTALPTQEQTMPPTTVPSGTILTPTLLPTMVESSPQPSAVATAESPTVSILPTAVPTATPTPQPTLAPPEPTPVTLTYTFPVQGSDITYEKYHHDYPATDIFCPIGSLFVAPISGVIDFVSTTDQWTPATNRPEHRGGIAVAMIGDDNVRYYGSHLLSVAPGVAPGVRVETGDVLGETGKSGNAADTPPHLHFGISRPTTPDDWKIRRGEVLPYPYLNAWKNGENLTPILK